jgi:hypothetical protein
MIRKGREPEPIQTLLDMPVTQVPTCIVAVHCLFNGHVILLLSLLAFYYYYRTVRMYFFVCIDRREFSAAAAASYIHTQQYHQQCGSFKLLTKQFDTN